MTLYALTASHIWADDTSVRFDGYLLADQTGLCGRCSAQALPAEAKVIAFGKGTLLPGVIDLQVNGGGGVLLNDAPTAQGIRAICAAHRALGTGGLLPTLITSDEPTLDQLIQNTKSLFAAAPDELLGLHLEGPHLSVDKRGIHTAEYIRPLTDEDLRTYEALAQHVPKLMITLAPESVSATAVSRLVAAGILVSLGHSNAKAAQLIPLVEAGASCVTHLYNAMSQLGSRAPGLVGVALSDDRLSAGIITDGFHVDPISIQVAFAAKSASKGLFLVSDAMHSVGSDMQSFRLDGRDIQRHNGRLTDTAGTLAGADISLVQGLCRAGRMGLSVSRDQLIAAAINRPATVLGIDAPQLQAGYTGPVVFIDEAWQAQVFDPTQPDAGVGCQTA